jgi:hypothetical protein
MASTAPERGRHSERRLVDRGACGCCARYTAAACYHEEVNTWSANLITVSSVALLCTVCGHEEPAHVLEDVPQALEKRGFCAECGDWHEFIPPQQT